MQLGFGTSGGCEAAVHAACQFLSSSSHSHPLVLLKVDYRDTFNSVRRNRFLHVVKEKFSCLLLFVWLAYHASAHLFFGDSIIPSTTGVQQGDPLGPVLFSLAIHSLIKELVSTFNVWYLDGTLGGSLQTVLADFTTILHQSPSLGLSLNISKCDVYISGALPSPLLGELQSVAPGVRRLDFSEVTLFGSPITLDALPSSFESKLSSIQTLMLRLETFFAHDAFYLLCHCFAIPKLLYILRTSPSWRVSGLLEKFDDLIRTSLQTVTNVNISPLLGLSLFYLQLRGFRDS